MFQPWGVFFRQYKAGDKTEASDYSLTNIYVYPTTLGSFDNQTVISFNAVQSVGNDSEFEEWTA